MLFFFAWTYQLLASYRMNRSGNVNMSLIY